MFVLVRMSGEIAIKSTNVSRWFQTTLVDNLKEALRRADIAAEVKWEWNRCLVTLPDDAPHGLDVIKSVFGVHSLSTIDRICASDFETILRAGEELYADKVKGKTFAVRTHRGKTIHTFNSMDVNQNLGARLKACGGIVNLTQPEILVQVDVRENETYIFSGNTRGVGGLPLRTGGSALCLLSGGFDSAVAAWSLMRRGVRCDFVFFNLAGMSYERAVLRIAKQLADRWGAGTKPRIFIVDFTKPVVELKAKVSAPYLQVILKRLFMRAATKIAQKGGYEALITGEAIGQVSSQTMKNLTVIDDATEMSVLRPLVSMNKDDIIDLARSIGTAEFSAGLQEVCQLTREKPNTACEIPRTQAQEARVDLAVLDEALAGLRIISLNQLTPSDLLMPYLQVEEIPAEAVVLDCRSRSEYDQWHYSGSEHRDFDEILERYPSYDKTRTYILYCQVGVQSTVIAEKMQNRGYLAYSFKGGQNALRQDGYKREETIDGGP